VIVPEPLWDSKPRQACCPAVRGALFGSDLPFDMADPDPVAMVRAAGHEEAAQVAVLHGNAERGLRRVVVAGGQRG
jgi:hypothetical protein